MMMEIHHVEFSITRIEELRDYKIHKRRVTKNFKVNCMLIGSQWKVW